MEYKEVFPTCPNCLNESLIILHNAYDGHWFKCTYCDYQENISIQRLGIFE